MAPSQWAIETEGLSRRFGERRAVDGLSLRVASGETSNGRRQISSLLLPVLALLAAEVAGAFLLGTGVAVAVVLVVLDAALLGWGRRLFDRERLLAEWR